MFGCLCNSQNLLNVIGDGRLQNYHQHVYLLKALGKISGGGGGGTLKAPVFQKNKKRHSRELD